MLKIIFTTLLALMSNSGAVQLDAGYSSDLRGCIVTPAPTFTFTSRTKFDCAAKCCALSCEAFNYYEFSKICEVFSLPGDATNFFNVDLDYKQATCKPYRNRISKLLVGCPYPFTYIKSNRQCLYVKGVRVDWPTANSTCLSYDAQSHLVVINNSTKDAQLQYYSESIKNTIILPKCGDYHLWTAGQRITLGICSVFYWKPYPNNSTWTQMVYSHWSSAEPNCSGGVEWCVHIWMSSYSWNDMPCYNTDYCPYCEVDL